MTTQTVAVAVAVAAKAKAKAIPTLASAFSAYLTGGRKIQAAVQHIAQVAAEGRKGAAIFAARRELIAGEMDKAREQAKAACRAAKGDWGNKDCGQYRTINNALDYVRRCVQAETGLEIKIPRGGDTYQATVPAAKAPTIKSKAPASPTSKAPLQGNASGDDESGADPAFNDEPAELAPLIPAIAADNKQAWLIALAQAYGSKAEMLAAIKDLPDTLFGETAEKQAAEKAAKAEAKKAKQAARVAKAAAKKQPLLKATYAGADPSADPSANPFSPIASPDLVAAEIAALESHLKTGSTSH